MSIAFVVKSTQPFWRNTVYWKAPEQNNRLIHLYASETGLDARMNKKVNPVGVGENIFSLSLFESSFLRKPDREWKCTLHKCTRTLFTAALSVSVGVGEKEMKKCSSSLSLSLSYARGTKQKGTFSLLPCHWSNLPSSEVCTNWTLELFVCMELPKLGFFFTLLNFTFEFFDHISVDFLTWNKKKHKFIKKIVLHKRQNEIKYEYLYWHFVFS